MLWWLTYEALEPPLATAMFRDESLILVCFLTKVILMLETVHGHF